MSDVSEPTNDPNAILYQHYMMDLRAKGALGGSLGIGRRTTPSAEAGFSTPRTIQAAQFGESRPSFSVANTDTGTGAGTVTNNQQTG